MGRIAITFATLNLIASACGSSSNDSKSDAATDGAKDATAADGALDASTTRDVDLGDAALAECPGPLDGAGASPNSGTELAEWVTAFDSSEGVLAMAADLAGGVVLATRARTGGDSIFIGDNEVYAGGDAAVVVAVTRLAANGDISWSHAIVPTTADDAWQPQLRLASSSNGVLFALASDRSTEVAGTTLNTEADQTAIVGRLDEQGLDWSTTHGSLVEFVHGFAADGADNSVLAARLEEASSGCSPALIGLDAQGRERFDRCVSSIEGGFFNIDALTIGPDGGAILSAFPRGRYDVGTGSKDIESSFGASVVFKFSTATGGTTWSTEFLRSYARKLRTSSDSSIFTTGHVPSYGEPNTVFADDSLSHCSRDEAFDSHLSALSSDGSRRSTWFMEHETPIAVSASGTAYLLTRNTGEVFAPGIEARNNVMLLSVETSGTVGFVQDITLEGDGDFGPQGIDVDPLGHIYVAGNFRGAVSIENGDRAQSEPGFGIIVMRFDR